MINIIKIGTNILQFLEFAILAHLYLFFGQVAVALAEQVAHYSNFVEADWIPQISFETVESHYPELDFDYSKKKLEKFLKIKRY